MLFLHSPRSALRSRSSARSDQGILLRAPATRTISIQTDYRDSETQTDPYSPEYVVQPGSMPELLTIASLCHGNVIHNYIIDVYTAPLTFIVIYTCMNEIYFICLFLTCRHINAF